MVAFFVYMATEQRASQQIAQALPAPSAGELAGQSGQEQVRRSLADPSPFGEVEINGETRPTIDLDNPYWIYRQTPDKRLTLYHPNPFFKGKTDVLLYPVRVIVQDSEGKDVDVWLDIFTRNLGPLEFQSHPQDPLHPLYVKHNGHKPTKQETAPVKLFPKTEVEYTLDERYRKELLGFVLNKSTAPEIGIETMVNRRTGPQTIVTLAKPEEIRKAHTIVREWLGISLRQKTIDTMEVPQNPKVEPFDFRGAKVHEEIHVKRTPWGDHREAFLLKITVGTQTIHLQTNHSIREEIRNLKDGEYLTSLGDGKTINTDEERFCEDFQGKETTCKCHLSVAKRSEHNLKANGILGILFDASGMSWGVVPTAKEHLENVSDNGNIADGVMPENSNLDIRQRWYKDSKIPKEKLIDLTPHDIFGRVILSLVGPDKVLYIHSANIGKIDGLKNAGAKEVVILKHDAADEKDMKQRKAMGLAYVYDEEKEDEKQRKGTSIGSRRGRPSTTTANNAEARIRRTSPPTTLAA